MNINDCNILKILTRISGTSDGNINAQDLSQFIDAYRKINDRETLSPLHIA